MLISHKNKVIFVHIPKTAGSSVSVSLYRYMGAVDIGVGCWSDAIDLGVGPNARMISWAVRPRGGLRLAKGMRRRRSFASSFNLAVKATSRQVLAHRDPGHMTAADLQDRFPEAWCNYYTICVMRNPYGRIVSDYFWRIRSVDNPPSFRDYLKGISADENIPSASVPSRAAPFYMLDGKIAVDRVCLYEDLEQELARAFEEAGLDWDGWLPHAKINAGGRFDYTSMYGKVERDIVRTLFKDEVELFGYSF